MRTHNIVHSLTYNCTVSTSTAVVSWNLVAIMVNLYLQLRKFGPSCEVPMSAHYNEKSATKMRPVGPFLQNPLNYKGSLSVKFLNIYC